MLLGSRNIPVHLLRGLIGLGALAVALMYSSVLGWWTLAPLAVALVSFRGCPMCWTVGLIETVLERKSPATCIDGSCAEVKSDAAAKPAPSEVEVGSAR